MKKAVRIGCYSAFWGDSVNAAHQLVKSGQLDYLVADYLAEVTMGILAKRRKVSDKNRLGGAGAGGYVAEFVRFVWKPLMADIMAKGIRVVTNAGGMDPVALKLAIEEACREAGVEPPIVAAVYGDDLMPDFEKIQSSFRPFSHVDQGKSSEFLPGEGKKIESLNAYFGAVPIRDALHKGAQVVVTGRVVDSAIVLGPLMHEFEWSETDYSKLAAGSLAGHIIECGCQATGGNFTDWKLSRGGWSNMGYPIVEVVQSGDFIVTKPPRTGGLVSVGTVGEQMIYEIADPSTYILPDVIVDLRFVQLKQVGLDRVHVSGVRGRPPTPYLKVSGIYMDGYKVTGEIFIGGLDAREKALSVGNAVIERVRKVLKKFGMDDFRGTNVEALGSEHTYGSHSRARDSREVVLRLSAHHNDVKALQLFLMEIAPSATCMAPGIIGVTSGRPRPTGNMVHFACLLEKAKICSKYRVGKDDHEYKVQFNHSTKDTAPSVPDQISYPKNMKSEVEKARASKLVFVPLVHICYARSGDKGDSANIGVLCRNPQQYPWVLLQLTEEKVADYFKHLLSSSSDVRKYPMPGCFGVNFVITNCLGGGGLSSLQVDRQGKSYAQMLLSMQIPVPSDWLKNVQSNL